MLIKLFAYDQAVCQQSGNENFSVSGCNFFSGKVKISVATRLTRHSLQGAAAVHNFRRWRHGPGLVIFLQPVSEVLSPFPGTLHVVDTPGDFFFQKLAQRQCTGYKILFNFMQF